MNRRSLLRRAAAAAVLAVLPRPSRVGFTSASASGFHRVRPSEPAWPDPSMWERLNREVGGRLIKVQSPLNVCRDAPDGVSCGDLFRELKNPYYIGDEVGMTQTAGWRPPKAPLMRGNSQP